MGKDQLNMRTDSTVLEIFKGMAEGRSISQSQLFKEMVEDKSQGKTLDFLKHRLEEDGTVIDEKDRIIQRLEKTVGKPIPKLRKVTFKVTDEQFEQLTLLAHELKINKGELMMRHFMREYIKSLSEIKKYLPA